MQVTDEELARRFGYHPPRSENRRRDHSYVRGELMDVAESLVSVLPDGREASLFLTKLEEAMFWANSALARSPDPDAEVSAEDAAAGPKEGS